MSVSTERLILDPASRTSIDGSLIAGQLTSSRARIPLPSDQAYPPQEKPAVMSVLPFQQAAEKPQLDSMIDVKETLQVEHVDPAKSAIAQEAERMAAFTGPKVRVKILLMSSQNHVFTFEPETTVGRVKEAIWHLWPADWNSDPVRPPSPAYFRLLYMGKMLSDDQTLSGLDMKIAPATTIIHLSVRTIPPDEESTKKSLLGFSLRPSMRGRPSSTNVVATHPSHPPSNTTNTAAPPATNPPNAQPQIVAAPISAAAPRPGTRTVETHATPATQTRSRTLAVDDGTHGTGSSGGGCKCVIM